MRKKTMEEGHSTGKLARRATSYLRRKAQGEADSRVKGRRKRGKS